MSVYGTQNNTSYQDTSSDSDSSYIDTDAYNATNSYSSQASSNSPSNGLSQPTTNRKNQNFKYKGVMINGRTDRNYK